MTVRQRLFAQPQVHRVFPAAAGVRVARRRADWWWSSKPAVRTQARLQMEFVAGVAGDGELERLARSYVFESLKREEFLWRAWRSTKIPVGGVDVLREANARSGVILSLMHHGQHTGVFGSIARQGFHLHLPLWPHFLREQPNAYSTLRVRQLLKTVRAGGTSVFNAMGSYRTVRDLLADGQIVAIAADMPGRAVTDFLGRTLGTESGTARLAIETGALVVPVTASPEGDLQRLTVGAPIDPATRDQAEVHQAVFAAHEPAIRRWPQALERPRRRFVLLDRADAARFGPVRDSLL